MVWKLLTLRFQLTIISAKLGKLTEEEMEFVTSEKARKFLKKLPNKKPLPLQAQFPGASAVALDAMRNMLQVPPAQRATVTETLRHEFFASLFSKEDVEPKGTPFDFSFEKEKLHRLRLQELIWKEAGGFRPSCLPVAPTRGTPDP